MVLWFNDANFNLKCKTKGKWKRAEFKNSHKFFRKTKNGVLGFFPFHPFPMDENFTEYFAGFDLGVFRNADLNRLITSEEQKWRRPPANRTFIEVCFQVFCWSLFFCSKYFREVAFIWRPASSDDDSIFLSAARILLALETFMTDMLPNCSHSQDMFEAKRWC